MVPTNNETPNKPARKIRRGWLWLAGFLALAASLGGAVFLGGLAGYRDAQVEHQWASATQHAISLLDQYVLGVQELKAGEYDLARQRFEYVLERDPSFPGAPDMLAEAMRVLYATATPTPIPPTPTLTPTRDLRPIEDLFAQAVNDFSQGNYDSTINTLVALRREDQLYRVVEVDRLLYLSFRNRGLLKIREQSNLEGGIFDLSLAERFGPLDSESNSYRNLARIYMIGSGFWEVYPEQAVYYFGQVAAAAPYLRDASGWTARERYRGALLQYGDQLAREGDWCAAEVQYALANDVRPDEAAAATMTNAAYECAPPTKEPSPTVDTLTPTFTPTLTFTPILATTVVPSVSPTVGVTVTPSPTGVPGVTSTPTVTLTPSPTGEITTVTPTDTEQPATPTPSPTETVIAEPTTPVPSEEPTATEAVLPTAPLLASETPTPTTTSEQLDALTPTVAELNG